MLSREFDVVCLGGGVAGEAIAANLQNSGLTLAVVAERKRLQTEVLLCVFDRAAQQDVLLPCGLQVVVRACDGNAKLGFDPWTLAAAASC